MDFSAALIVGLVLMGAKFFDWWASTQLARPIFCVAILGALLGHLQEGIILAAQLELVFIGNVSLGGVMPSDITMGSIFGAAFALVLGQDIETAVVLAVPLAALGTLIYSCMKIVVTSLVPRFETLLANHNFAAYNRLWIAQFVCFELCYFVLGFVCMLAGQPVVAAFVAAIPAWLNAALKVAAAALPALGLALLLKQLYTKDTFPYYFLGFGLVAFFGYNVVTKAEIVDGAVKLVSANTALLSLVEIAVIGGVIAAVVIFNELRRIDDKAAMKSSAASSNDEEDFFND